MSRKKTLIFLGAMIILLLTIGLSYSYYVATVKFNNKSQTIIKTDQVSLVYTGVKEITTGNNMIPGDSFTKTFTVENTSDVKTTYNIYMESITNEFNEDLVYVLSDDNGEIVSETPLPETNASKSYLLEDIEIEASEIQTYTLKIEFKYLDTPQNDYQGKNFKATVGIDANQIESAIPSEPIALKYYAFGLPTISSTTDYKELMNTEGVNIFVQLEGEQLSACMYRNDTLECFKNNNYVEEVEHMKQIFGEENCTNEEDVMMCADENFDCFVATNGNVACNSCNVFADNTATCGY